MSSTGPFSPYVGDASRAYHEGKRAVPDTALPWVVRARAELFEAQIRPDSEVFEWGCGFGWNLAGLRCGRRVGHDVAIQLRTALEAHGIEFVENPDHIEGERFDAVICHHALEHVPDPFAVLRGIRRLLKQDGRLLLAVPFEKERRYRKYDPNEPNHHLYSWNVQTLANLVSAAGLLIHRSGLRSYGYDRRAALVALRLHSGEAGFRAIRKLIRMLRPLREVALEAAPT